VNASPGDAAATTLPVYFGGLQVGPATAGPADLATTSSQLIDTDPVPEPPGGTTRGRYSQPFVLTGKVVRDTGVPLAEAVVQISLDPGPSLLGDNKDDAEGLPLGAATTDSSGAFSVNIPGLKSKYIKNYQEADGGVTLAFSAFGIDYSMMETLPVTLPKSSEDSIWSMAEDDNILDPVEIQRTQDLRDQGLEDNAVGTGIIAENLTLTAASVGSQNGTATSVPDPDFDPQQRCDSLDYWEAFPIVPYKWTRGTTSYLGWVPLQKLQTRGQTTENFDWSTTNSTQVKVGMDYQYSGTTAQAGYSHSVVNGAGHLFSQGHYLTRQYRGQWDFRYYYLKCYLNGSWVSAGVRELKPYLWTAGQGYDNYYGYTCNYKAPVLSGPTWVSRSTSYTRVHGVGVNGFSLDTTVTNGTYWKKTFYAGSSGAWLCGENAWVPYTDRSMEVDS
jgi:hypothetical protein